VIGQEVESLAWYIPGGADFPEEVASWNRGRELHWLADCDSATPAMILAANVLHKTIRPRLEVKNGKCLLNKIAFSERGQMTVLSRIFQL
jgi:hypothetical protein